MDAVGNVQVTCTKLGESYHCEKCDLKFQFLGEYWTTVEPRCPGCGSKEIKLVKSPSAFPEALCLGSIYLDTLVREEALINSMETTKNPEALIEKHSKLWEDTAVRANELDKICNLNIPCGSRTTDGKIGDMNICICPLSIGREAATKRHQKDFL